jgi:hypothetical protein
MIQEDRQTQFHCFKEESFVWSLHNLNTQNVCTIESQGMDCFQDNSFKLSNPSIFAEVPSFILGF